MLDVLKRPVDDFLLLPCRNVPVGFTGSSVPRLIEHLPPGGLITREVVRPSATK